MKQGQYLIKGHAVQHALKEGFDRNHMVEVVLYGTVIEEYEGQRSLICGKVKLEDSTDIYLHLICEYADPVYVEFVTAYIPDPDEWEKPPLKRRHN